MGNGGSGQSGGGTSGGLVKHPICEPFHRAVPAHLTRSDRTRRQAWRRKLWSGVRGCVAPASRGGHEGASSCALLSLHLILSHTALTVSSSHCTSSCHTLLSLHAPHAFTHCSHCTSSCYTLLSLHHMPSHTAFNVLSAVLRAVVRLLGGAACGVRLLGGAACGVRRLGGAACGVRRLGGPRLLSSSSSAR